MINFLIVLGWLLNFLKLMLVYWYVSLPVLIFLVLYIYIDHRRKLR
jgi:hypothetical protein